MNQNQLIQEIEAELLKTDLPKFAVGDTLTVHTRIIEGEKERLQAFTGTVIAKRGGGLSETMALYRVSYGAGIERVFMIHSPKIAKIEIIRLGKVRKSKLYYLRGTSGKKSKVKGRIQERKQVKVLPKTDTTQAE
ncbi:MAG: 50S ribosomal protein L19 [Chlamydiota bacterium]